MARLCLASRRGGPVVLLLDRLHDDANARALVAAAHRYVPSLTIWTFDPAASPQLRAYVEDVEETPADDAVEPPRRSGPGHFQPVSVMISAPNLTLRSSPPPGSPPGARPVPPAGPRVQPVRTPPTLRLTDDPPVRPAPSENEADEQGEGGSQGLSSLLSDEELAMLLADEPGPGQTDR